MGSLHAPGSRLGCRGILTGPIEKHWTDDHLAFADVVPELFLATDAEPSESGLQRFRPEKSRAIIEFYEQQFGSAAVPLGFDISASYLNGGRRSPERRPATTWLRRIPANICRARELV